MLQSSQLTHTNSKGKLQPVIAKTDFSLQQQMMGIGRCKDLDEWLVGSGESADTSDSKKFLNSLHNNVMGEKSGDSASGQASTQFMMGSGSTATFEQSSNTLKTREAFVSEKKEEKSEEVGADWMFQTFDHQKKAKKESKQKGLDPFEMIDEEDEDSD